MMEGSTAFAIVMMAVTIPIVILGGLGNRNNLGKGIGWQFIRFSIICCACPVIGILALKDNLNGNAATLIGAIVAYAFVKSEDEPKSGIRVDKKTN